MRPTYDCDFTKFKITFDLKIIKLMINIASQVLLSNAEFVEKKKLLLMGTILPVTVLMKETTARKGKVVPGVKILFAQS